MSLTGVKRPSGLVAFRDNGSRLWSFKIRKKNKKKNKKNKNKKDKKKQEEEETEEKQEEEPEKKERKKERKKVSKQKLGTLTQTFYIASPGSNRYWLKSGLTGSRWR